MRNLRNPRWWDAAGTRALKTAAQTFIALAGTNTMGFTDVDWPGVVSGVAFSAVLSLVTSLAGLPEVEG